MAKTKPKIPNFECERLHISREGYASNGQYFGYTGVPVYRLYSSYDGIGFDKEPVERYRVSYIRARSKAEARAKHHRMYPDDKAELNWSHNA